MDLIEVYGMTATTSSTVKDQELVSFGLVESATVNSFADFIPSKFNKSKVSKEKETEKEKDDFINTFICHMIFYAVFCCAIILHILIDLGLGSFIKKKFVKLIGLEKKTILRKTPVFA